MKITQTRLKQIIQEELAAVAAEGWKHAQADTADAAASRDIDIYQTYENVLHLSSYLDTKEERDVVEQAAEILKNYSDVLEEGELEEAALEEGRCPPGHHWKSFGGRGGTCVKDPDYKGPQSAYSQGGTVSPPRGSYTPKYEE